MQCVLSMKVRSIWREKMRFIAEADHHAVPMDTKIPIGDDTALSPKQMVLAALCGCSGMEIVACLTKHKQPIAKFEIEVDASLTQNGHPIIFQEIMMTYLFEGVLDVKKVIEAVRLSQTLYCSVGAMLSKSAALSYIIQLNSVTIGTGQSNFEKPVTAVPS